MEYSFIPYASLFHCKARVGAIQRELLRDRLWNCTSDASASILISWKFHRIPQEFRKPTSLVNPLTCSPGKSLRATRVKGTTQLKSPNAITITSLHITSVLLLSHCVILRVALSMGKSTPSWKHTSIPFVLQLWYLYHAMINTYKCGINNDKCACTLEYI